ncbi:uncharacterized protein F4822DRAFT_371302 [Hypoxylon trugodes]|uniref:uncharacterized protein n=1 Tax=Hypoxylon trugodes TaxID=326681 RepID=UPI0021941DB7|nr:uncharacterized protein F4822DRAFT_371302 [Hypoxylon trugodes]KAI1384712.1 hypothetical protein F4822DRAFT_371302 [Hypoxylon trugodes]
MDTSSSQCGSFDYPFCTDQVRTAPAGTCCEAPKQCLLFAANSTVVCCPDNDCSVIDPITCDITQQVFPADILTTIQKGNLPRCGNQCCPWGFHCTESGDCEADADQDQLPDVVEFPSPYANSNGTASPVPYNTTAAPPKASVVVVTSAYPMPSLSQSSNAGSGMSVAEIIGISLSAIFGLALIALGAYLIRNSRKAVRVLKDTEQGRAAAAVPAGSRTPAGFNRAPAHMGGGVMMRAELDSNPVCELMDPAIIRPVVTEPYELPG